MKDFDIVSQIIKLLGAMTGVFVFGIVLRILWICFHTGWTIFDIFK